MKSITYHACSSHGLLGGGYLSWSKSSTKTGCFALFFEDFIEF